MHVCACEFLEPLAWTALRLHAVTCPPACAHAQGLLIFTLLICWTLFAFAAYDFLRQQWHLLAPHPPEPADLVEGDDLAPHPEPAQLAAAPEADPQHAAPLAPRADLALHRAGDAAAEAQREEAAAGGAATWPGDAERARQAQAPQLQASEASGEQAHGARVARRSGADSSSDEDWADAGEPAAPELASPAPGDAGSPTSAPSAPLTDPPRAAVWPPAADPGGPASSSAAGGARSEARWRDPTRRPMSPERWQAWADGMAIRGRAAAPPAGPSGEAPAAAPSAAQAGAAGPPPHAPPRMLRRFRLRPADAGAGEAARAHAPGPAAGAAAPEPGPGLGAGARREQGRAVEDAGTQAGPGLGQGPGEARQAGAAGAARAEAQPAAGGAAAGGPPVGAAAQRGVRNRLGLRRRFMNMRPRPELVRDGGAPAGGAVGDAGCAAYACASRGPSLQADSGVDVRARVLALLTVGSHQGWSDVLAVCAFLGMQQRPPSSLPAHPADRGAGAGGAAARPSSACSDPACAAVAPGAHAARQVRVEVHGAAPRGAGGAGGAGGQLGQGHGGAGAGAAGEVRVVLNLMDLLGMNSVFQLLEARARARALGRVEPYPMHAVFTDYGRAAAPRERSGSGPARRGACRSRCPARAGAVALIALVAPAGGCVAQARERRPVPG